MSGRTTYIQCRKTGKMIEKSLYFSENRQREMASTEFVEFKSPIDGKMICDRRQLAAHNKTHGVTDMRDYTQSHFDKAAKQRDDVLNGRAEGQRESRVNDLKRTMHMLNKRR